MDIEGRLVHFTNYLSRSQPPPSANDLCFISDLQHYKMADNASSNGDIPMKDADNDIDGEPSSDGSPVSSDVPRHRSVMDCDNEISLRWALMEAPYTERASAAAQSNSSNSGDTENPSCSTCPLPPLCDWQTPHLSLGTTDEPQNLNDEVKRLMALKEYSILDSEQEEKFERITALASRIFEVPICLVSLVDIGRQWFMSNRYVSSVRWMVVAVDAIVYCVNSLHALLLFFKTLQQWSRRRP